MTPSAAPAISLRLARSLPRLLALSMAGALLAPAASSQAAPSSRSSRAARASRLKASNAKASNAARAVAARKGVAARKNARPYSGPPMPRYLPPNQIELLRAAQANVPWTGLTPTVDGRLLPSSMPTLPGAGMMGYLPPGLSAPGLPRLKAGARGKAPKPRTRGSAQVFPGVIAPAPVRPRAPAAAPVPRWVRYPLEFQLCGIGIGTRAVDKDRFNRIDRYGLFALHGNPTSVVVPGLLSTTGTGGPGDVASGGGGGGSEGGGGGSSSGGRGGSSGGGSGGGPGGPSTSAAPSVQNIPIPQQPPEVAALFPDSPNGGIPDWAAAITVQLDNNHVQWLYNRDTYSMGFVVDRLGFCDAIVVAGTASPIADTQLEDPVHTIRLGDDLRKVMNRYGYPDTIESYTTAIVGVGLEAPAGAGGAEGGSGAGGSGGAPGGGRGSSGGPGGGSSGGSGGGSSGGSGGGAATAEVGNEAFRTFELRYEQSYNVVFTIRNNRVVRIYIFGDPDFFNERRRRQFRVSY